MYYHVNNPAGGVRSSASVLEKRFIKMGHTCLGVSEGRSLTLTGADQHDSLLWSREMSNPKGTAHRWAPYGSGKPADAALPGFNGERIDPVSGSYHLGNGYRAYNPVLMRFNCPDSLSPFGAGGINPYAYLTGDPVNHTDPSGHLSWQAILGITLGAIGLVAAIFTGGMAIAPVLAGTAALSSISATSVVVGGLGVVADVTAIASGAVEDSDPAASSILGWVSLGFGIPGMITGLAGLGKSIKGFVKGRGSYKLVKTRLLSTNKESNIIILGGNMRNTDLLGNNIYAFTDTYKGGERLNIVSHGRMIGESARISFNSAVSGLAYLDGNDLAEWLRYRYNLDAYDNLRIVSCYSANGGELSFASQFSKATRKPVKGYINQVAVYPTPDYMAPYLEECNLFGNYTQAIDFLAISRKFRVFKFNPYKPNRESYYTWSYQPVKFYPS